MCFHSKQTKSATELQNRFKATLKDPQLFSPQAHLNGFEHPATPIIINQEPEQIQHAQWGLIPGWAKDESIRRYTLNAKIETLHEKPSFKDSLPKRCLILANGFYEWQWLDAKGKAKQAYEIGLADEAPFAFAGLYAQWMCPQTGNPRTTYTIITTQASPFMETIHNSKKRMPVILAPEHESPWLDQAPIAEFGFPYAVALEARKVN